MSLLGLHIPVQMKTNPISLPSTLYMPKDLGKVKRVLAANGWLESQVDICGSLILMHTKSIGLLSRQRTDCDSPKHTRFWPILAF